MALKMNNTRYDSGDGGGGCGRGGGSKLISKHNGRRSMTEPVWHFWEHNVHKS